MKSFIEKHKGVWNKYFFGEVLFGVFFLAIGILTTYYANIYTVAHASNAVTDIILDNIPVVNVEIIFAEGATIFIAVVFAIAVYDPKRIPFVLKAAALFFVVRSFFMVLTHIGPPVSHSPIDPTDLIYRLSSGDDLFFSAHTGMPFLYAFVFWDHKYLRYLFLAFTLIGGTAVLLGHLHYSIDVFSALFIAFGVYHMAKHLFERDYKLLHSTIS